MVMQTKHEVFFQRYYPRYHALHSKREKTAMLSEIQQVLLCSRKHILKKLREGPKCRFKTHTRKKIYDHEFCTKLFELWESSGYMCAELFHSFVHSELAALLHTKQFICSIFFKRKLELVSIGTLKRIFAKAKKSRNIAKGFSTTRTTPRGLKLSVAIRTNNWDIQTVGWHETDYVAHCGHVAVAPYLCSLNFVDIKTKWCSLEVVKRANQQEIFQAFQRIESRLPYKLRGINPDNGSEFINHMVVKYYQNRDGVEYTRSRAYRKNDNALVERKNCTVIRKYVGYKRYESEEAFEMIQCLYARLEIFLNFFQPTQVVTVYELPNGKLRHKRSKGKTPYRMVLGDETVSKEVTLSLRARKCTYRVLELVQDIQQLQEKLKGSEN